MRAPGALPPEAKEHRGERYVDEHYENRTGNTQLVDTQRNAQQSEQPAYELETADHDQG